MDEQTIHERSAALCDALAAGDVGRASQEMSPELQRNLGEVVAMLPLPLTEATVESVDMTGTAYRAVLSLAGEHETVRLETRWKDRDGRPMIVEASRMPDAAADAGAQPESVAPTDQA